MNNKKTIIFATLFSLFAIIGILVFSFSIQKIWQASNEVENILTLNDNDIVLTASIDYPYDKIENADIPTVFDDENERYILSSISVTSNEDAFTLQQIANFMGEFAKIHFGNTQMQHTPAYIDYLKLEFSYDYISYHSYLNFDNGYMRLTASFDPITRFPIAIKISDYRTQSDTFKTIPFDEKDSLTITEEDKLRIAEETKYLLDILGFSTNIKEQTFAAYGSLSIKDGVILHDGVDLAKDTDLDLCIRYVTYVTLDDGTRLNMDFFADDNNLYLHFFSNHSLSSTTFSNF